MGLAKAIEYFRNVSLYPVHTYLSSLQRYLVVAAAVANGRFG
jgi:hypothetical protein